ncbi:hypothetical protein VPH35_120352 [Triticum aestivum]|uniref:neurofilament medium polypeptide n=1 Tax=Triticum aestivum TaxID=4565 RepID=UPI000844B614|nr:neurofilament medium polypeptide-like [Triticum aestivum]
MVVALGPGRFYGGGLPRPRVFPGDRVDPPAPVTDALLCWARDAHWSMGGLGAKRLRLQGRIEGNLVKLRRTARRDARVSAKSKVRAAGHGPAPATLDDALGSDDDGSEDEAEVAAQEKAMRREVVDDDEDSESGESEGEGVPLVTIAAAAKRKRVRKLSDEFDRIAAAQLEGGGKKKPAAAAPAKVLLRKKAVAAAAPAPATEAPAKKSLKRKAVAPAAGAVARTSPKRKTAKAPAAKTSPKRKTAEAPAARRTSPRSKH